MPRQARLLNGFTGPGRSPLGVARTSPDEKGEGQSAVDDTDSQSVRKIGDGADRNAMGLLLISAALAKAIRLIHNGQHTLPPCSIKGRSPRATRRRQQPRSLWNGPGRPLSRAGGVRPLWVEPSVPERGREGLES